MSVAIAYTRVSSEQQAGEKQTSLADQRAAIDALAVRLQVDIVERFEDAGISGATVAKRPGLRALLAYCVAHPRDASALGYVLILNDSRFGRFDDPDESAALRFQLKRDGWLVRFCEADESDDPTARHVMRAIGSAQASEYRRNLRANSLRGRTGTTKGGYWATRAPFGYRRAVVFPAPLARVLEHGQSKARGEKIKLTPGPAEEVALVREIFRRYASGAWSMCRLCAWLDKEPVATLGRQPWSVTALRILLENHAYLGAIPCRRRTATRMERGDFSRQAPEYIVWDAHEPLIDRETFDRAQAQLQDTPARGDVHDYRVRGLVVCATCGEPFVGGGLGSRLASTGERSRFYICQGGRARSCEGRAACVSSHLLEDAVIREVSAHVATEITTSALQRALSARMTPQGGETMPDATKARQRVMARRERLVAAIESGAMTADEAKPRLAAIRTELATLDAAPVIAPEAREVRAQLDRLVSRARDFAALAAAATGPELRALMRTWVDGAQFDKQTRTLTLRLRTLSSGLTVGSPTAGD